MIKIKHIIQVTYLFLLAIIDFFIFKEVYSNSIIDYIITSFLIVNTILIFIITKDEVSKYFSELMKINKDLDNNDN
jgi:hypothetical protein